MVLGREGERKLVDGREEHCSLVFYPTDGDRYGTAHECKALAGVDRALHVLSAKR